MDWKHHQSVREGINNKTDKCRKQTHLRHGQPRKPPENKNDVGFIRDTRPTVTYLIRSGDDVHTDHLFRQHGFRVDAVEPGSQFCILGQGLQAENISCTLGSRHEDIQTKPQSITGLYTISGDCGECPGKCPAACLSLIWIVTKTNRHLPKTHSPTAMLTTV